jgi:hypothetical protein
VSERFSTEVTAEFQEADVIDYTHKSAVFGSILRALTVCVLAAGACAGSALAHSQYTYTGKALTSFGGGDRCPTTCSISGSFTLATAIGWDNIVLFITPESWSFTDGTEKFNSSNSVFEDIGFETNSSGNIVDWVFAVYSDSLPIYIESAYTGPGTAFDLSTNDDTGAFASNTNPGTWAVSTVLEPSELLLLSVGLIGLISLCRMKIGRAASN